MSRYRRLKIPGGTFFFTVVLAERGSDLLVRHIDLLRNVYREVARKYPFETIAICVLPDHLHAIWSLPEDDADFALRWNLVKGGFSRSLPTPAERTNSKRRRREKGIWQRRYWEHFIRDDRDLGQHIDYIHFNPVRHRIVARACDWPHSSFHRYVERGDLPLDWGGDTSEFPDVRGE
jgi:putative transposase